MARNFRRKHASHPIADLNVTNLIDLGFMLLIIFMVATPLIQQEQQMPLNLPFESASPQSKPDPNERFETITVQADGSVLLRNQPYSIRQLVPELARFAAEPKPPVMHLRCDANAKVQQFITVMDELKKHGLTRIAFDTQVER